MAMKPSTGRRAFNQAGVSLLAGWGAGSARAQSPDFAGKTVELYAPGGAGSGNDIYARTLAPHLAANLPGKPRVQVRTIPGAGTITGANQFQQQARPDGLSVISVSASTVVNYALKDERVKFDLPSWRTILMSPQGALVYGSPSLGIKAPADVVKIGDRQLIYGGSSFTSSDLRVVMSLHLLGLRVRPVWGVDRGPARLGFERGEFNVNVDSAPGFVRSSRQMITEGKAVPLFTFGIEDAKGQLVRDPVFPDVPTYLEAYQQVHGRPLDGIERRVWFALFQQAIMTNKYMALPAATPDVIVEVYRAAFRKVITDPQSSAKVAPVLEGYDQVIGPEGDAIVKNASALPTEVTTWIAGWLRANYKVDLR